MAIHLSIDPHFREVAIDTKNDGAKGELGDGVRMETDRGMSTWRIPFACEKKTRSWSADNGSTNRLKKNNTNNNAQGFYCTNIPIALSPQLS